MRYLIVLIDHSSEGTEYPNDEDEYQRTKERYARNYGYTQTHEYTTPDDKRLDKIVVSIMQKIEC